MSANDTQVGGTHYKTSFEHWDLAHDLDLGYFEGQITRYITRHRAKKGLEDARKCLHFAKKLKELAVLHARQPRHQYATGGMLTDYQTANMLVTAEMLVIRSAVSWQHISDLEVLIDRIEVVLDLYYAGWRPSLPVLTDAVGDPTKPFTVPPGLLKD